MPVVVTTWVWLCAYLNCAGWALSAIHRLNAGGYAVALLVWFAALCLWRKRTARRFLPRPQWLKLYRRFRRPFPLAFLVLAALAFLGGALYAPVNYDALAYRIPRVLHWLAAGQWHWIHTVFLRLNGRACGTEWVSAPLLALLQTDRWLFLLNLVSLLLLPGLVFSIFTRLGVRPRVASYWMWLLPTGYCFLLQAGSIGNDLFGAPFALAAVDFALRAKSSRSQRDCFTSVLAAALLTSAKATNLPLLLPWAVAILPSLKPALRRPIMTAGICVIAIFASFLPTAVLNAHFCNDWTGCRAEGIPQRNNLALRTAGNLALITFQNLTPPVFPPAEAWNRCVQKVMPAALNLRLHQNFVEPNAAELRVQELQIEETAGMGFGVTVLALASVLLAARRGGFRLSLQLDSAEAAWRTGVRLAPWVSLLVLLSQSGVYPIDRILAPYYLLLAPLFFTGAAHARLVRKRGWRVAAFAVFVIAAVPLFLTPARPLIPVDVYLRKKQFSVEQHPLLARAQVAYSVYADRNDAFAPVRAFLPPDLQILGLVTCDDPETSLWRPFGSRRIKHVCPEDTAADLKRRGIEYVLVKTADFEAWFGCSPADWIERMHAQVLQKIPLRLRAGSPVSDWYLVELR